MSSFPRAKGIVWTEGVRRSEGSRRKVENKAPSSRKGPTPCSRLSALGSLAGPRLLWGWTELLRGNGGKVKAQLSPSGRGLSGDFHKTFFAKHKISKALDSFQKMNVESGSLLFSASALSSLSLCAEPNWQRWRAEPNLRGPELSAAWQLCCPASPREGSLSWSWNSLQEQKVGAVAH